MNEYELYHFGIKGMKWGVRRYQNKDGSLTPEGKKHVSAYNKHKANLKKETDEGNRLIRKSKEMSEGFGGKFENVDDPALFELAARNIGLNTDSFWNAHVNTQKFYQDNKDSIQRGRKIVKKLYNK